jgi:drug/metabolite transporter (DMT)-like permease
VVSGVSNFVNFKAVQGTNVDAWIAVRNSFVAFLLLPPALLLRRGVRVRIARADWVRLAAIGLLGGAVPFLLYFHGFQLALGQGGAAAASLGYRCLFLIATVFAVVFLRERLPRRFGLAAVLLLAGNVLLLAVSGPIWTDGSLYVLLATAMWAGEYTMSKRAMRTLPSGVVGLGRMGFGAVFLLGYLGLTGQAASIAGFRSADWSSLAFSALLLFAFVATWYAGLKTVDLSVASSLLVLSSPITWILGVAVSGSGAALGQAIGAGVVFMGAGLALGWVFLRDAWTAVGRRMRSRILRPE